MPGNELLKSVLRVVDVFDALARAPGGRTLQELALELRVRGTTLHNLLRTLVARDMLELVSPGRRYRLGRHFFELARTCYDSRLLSAVEREIRALRENCQASTVWFAGGTPAAVTALYRISKSHPYWLQQPGRRLHPYANICSLVFQAFWTPALRDAFARTYPFALYGATIWHEESELSAFLEEARAGGYAALSTGSGLSVAFPLFDAAGVVVGAVGAHVAGTPRGSAEERALIERLRGHAAALQERLNSGDVFGFPWEGQLHRPMTQTPVSGPE